MPKDTSAPGPLPIEVWEHLRAAEALYDGAIDVVINESRGRFHHRPNGYSSLRITGLRIVLLIEYGERVSKSALSSRIGKLVEAKRDTLKLSGWSKTSIRDINIKEYVQGRRAPTPDLVFAARARYTGPSCGASKTLHLDYWLKPSPRGTGYDVLPIKNAQVLAEEGMHPEVCQFDVVGDSVANLKISFRTQWGFSRTARVTVFDNSKPACSAWTMDAPGPRGSRDRVIDDRLLDFSFPNDVYEHAMTCNPENSTFMAVFELQDTSLCMNMALHRIYKHIAPVGKLMFRFRCHDSLPATDSSNVPKLQSPPFSSLTNSTSGSSATNEGLPPSPQSVDAAVVPACTEFIVAVRPEPSGSSSAATDACVPSSEFRRCDSSDEETIRSTVHPPWMDQRPEAVPAGDGLLSSTSPPLPTSTFPADSLPPPHFGRVRHDSVYTVTPLVEVLQAQAERGAFLPFVHEKSTQMPGPPLGECLTPPEYSMVCVSSDRLSGDCPEGNPRVTKTHTRRAETAPYPLRLPHTHAEPRMLTLGRIPSRQGVGSECDPLQSMINFNGSSIEHLAVRNQDEIVDSSNRYGGVRVDKGDTRDSFPPFEPPIASGPSASFGTETNKARRSGFQEHAFDQMVPRLPAGSVMEEIGSSHSSVNYREPVLNKSGQGIPVASATGEGLSLSDRSRYGSCEGIGFESGRPCNTFDFARNEVGLASEIFDTCEYDGYGTHQVDRHASERSELATGAPLVAAGDTASSLPAYQYTQPVVGDGYDVDFFCSGIYLSESGHALPLQDVSHHSVGSNLDLRCEVYNNLSMQGMAGLVGEGSTVGVGGPLMAGKRSSLSREEPIVVGEEPLFVAEGPDMAKEGLFIPDEMPLMAEQPPLIVGGSTLATGSGPANDTSPDWNAWALGFSIQGAIGSGLPSGWRGGNDSAAFDPLFDLDSLSFGSAGFL